MSIVISMLAFISHEIDHIIAEKHGGSTESENLA
jgi:HNH endonuclease